MKLATAPRRATRRAAFTLLEVLVVVAILVILAGVGVVATTRYIDDARKSKAQMACQGIYTAMESYKNNPANTTNDYPSSLQELINPSIGGTGFLKNGQQDLMDPWGQQYQMQQTQMGDGTTGIIVFTHARDGTNTPISQYGIGPASKVN